MAAPPCPADICSAHRLGRRSQILDSASVLDTVRVLLTSLVIAPGLKPQTTKPLNLSGRAAGVDWHAAGLGENCPWPPKAGVEDACAMTTSLKPGLWLEGLKENTSPPPPPKEGLCTLRGLFATFLKMATYLIENTTDTTIR